MATANKAIDTGATEAITNVSRPVVDASGSSSNNVAFDPASALSVTDYVVGLLLVAAAVGLVKFLQHRGLPGLGQHVMSIWAVGSVIVALIVIVSMFFGRTT